MSTPASFSCARSETNMLINAMSDLVRRQVAPDDVSKYNLPWLYTHVYINNDLHRDRNGHVKYYADTSAVETALFNLVHHYGPDTLDPSTVLEAFKRPSERSLAAVLRQHVLFQMYDEKINITAFDLDKVKEIFKLSGISDNPSAQGDHFFTSQQITEIVQDFVSGDRPVMIQVPAGAAENANHYYFPEPDVGDVIGIVVNCSDNSSESGDFIHSTPQRFVMCMILQGSDESDVGWQTAATNVPTLTEVVEGVENDITTSDLMDNVLTLGIAYQDAVKLELDGKTSDSGMDVAREAYINMATAAITILSTQYINTGDIKTELQYIDLTGDYVNTTSEVFNKLLSVTTYHDHQLALEARVVERTTLFKDVPEAEAELQDWIYLTPTLNTVEHEGAEYVNTTQIYVADTSSGYILLDIMDGRRQTYINIVTQTITLVSTLYANAVQHLDDNPGTTNENVVAKATAYTNFITAYVDTTKTVYDMLQTTTTWDDHRLALEAQVTEKITLVGGSTAAQEALNAWLVTFPPFDGNP